MARSRSEKLPDFGNFPLCLLIPIPFENSLEALVAIIVVEKYNISTSSPGDYRLPRVSGRASENVQRPNVISVGREVAVHAPKVLSDPVFFGDPLATRARSGGVFRIDAYKTNTVFLGELFDPRNYLPEGPGGKRFSKRLSSTFPLASFQSGQVLDANSSDLGPRQRLDRSIDVIPPGSNCPSLAVTLRLASADASADLLDFFTISLAIRVHQQLIHANVHTQDGTIFGLAIRQFDVKARPSIPQDTAVQQLRPRL